MPLRRIRNVGLFVLAAVVFGAGLSVLKGNGSGIRDALGNLSAPWLVLPFVVGAVAGRGRLLLGAMLGLVLSLVALAGFYAANAFVLELGPHPWLVDLRLTFDGGQRFFELALVSGPVFGALGAWWKRTRSILIPAAVAALFMLEPVAELATRFSGSGIVWAGEAIVGLVAVVLLVRWAPKQLPS